MDISLQKDSHEIRREKANTSLTQSSINTAILQRLRSDTFNSSSRQNKFDSKCHEGNALSTDMRDMTRRKTELHDSSQIPTATHTIFNQWIKTTPAKSEHPSAYTITRIGRMWSTHDNLDKEKTNDKARAKTDDSDHKKSCSPLERNQFWNQQEQTPQVDSSCECIRRLLLPELGLKPNCLGSHTYAFSIWFSLSKAQARQNPTKNISDSEMPPMWLTNFVQHYV